LQYILSETLSKDRYADLLGALFGFYVPLEDYLSEREAASTPLVMPLIRRAGLLERDLGAFGRTPEQMPRCTEMPTLTTVDHLAGAVYVVEGACLGGQVIARAVMQRLRITRENGAAFFNGDGAQTGARWKQVLAWLDQRDRRRGARDDIAAGACRTFAALSHWLMAREVLDE
jgi:heme oxygenase